MNTIKFAGTLITIITLIVTIQCELFSAVAGLDEMFNVEGLMVEYLNEYVNGLEKKIDYFQSSYANISAKKNLSAIVRKENRNQTVNTFLITKRLASESEWNLFEELAHQNMELKKFSEKVKDLKNDFKLPSKGDLNGAAIALIRLQETYKLNATDLANGKIKDIQSSKMSALDCLDIGTHAFRTQHYYQSTVWFELALSLYSTQDNQNKDEKITLLESLNKVYVREKNYPAAQKINNQILEIDPDNESSLILEQYIENALKSSRKSITELRQFDEDLFAKRILEYENPLDYIKNPMFSSQNIYEDRLYKAVCRGDIAPTPKQLAPLRCRYLTNNLPFLKIAPFKVEEVALEPYIIVYHDVMSDKEIEVVIQLSQPKLKRAGVTTQEDASKDRISKSAFLHDRKHKVIADITARVADMTKLSMDAAEDLQVVNYGIGGFYNLHYDFAVIGDEVFDSLGQGNRVATVLFYMTDVTYGGSTAFPLIKRAIAPKKGTAVFWWNLHKSGVRDLRTMHAGCPVLVGSKWVSNKWIHVYHQELLQPCGLQPDHPKGQFDN